MYLGTEAAASGSGRELAKQVDDTSRGIPALAARCGPAQVSPMAASGESRALGVPKPRGGAG